MWIKKISKSIYVSIVFTITLSTLVSLCLYFGLVKMADQYIFLQNNKHFQQEYEEIDSIYQAIQEIVNSYQLSLGQVKTIDFNQLDIYETIYFENKKEIVSMIENYEIEIIAEPWSNSLENPLEPLIKTNGYRFAITFVDLNAFIEIRPTNIDTNSNELYILSTLISLFVFFVLTIYLLYRQLSYIKVVEQGIKIIAKEDMLYKIPIKGSNELQSLATSINEMGEQLHTKIQQERDNELAQRLLITNISHDLKTPLTSMIGYMDIVQSKIDQSSELYEYTSIAKRNGKRLEKLINDLFLYSKLISRDVIIHNQNLDLCVMMKQIVEMRIEHITYAEQVDKLLVSVDPLHLHRVIDNLLSNAFKYGKQLDSINITVYQEDGFAMIRMDNVTEDDLSNRLDFIKTRLNTGMEDRSNGSSGLGLSIVEELLLTMNGQLLLQYDNYVFSAIIKLPSL